MYLIPLALAVLFTLYLFSAIGIIIQTMPGDGDRRRDDLLPDDFFMLCVATTLRGVFWPLTVFAIVAGRYRDLKADNFTASRTEYRADAYDDLKEARHD